tara:strand:- start:1660 stop:1875 length:216 start_codon:yes stop_codon:yes gene_type:complete
MRDIKERLLRIGLEIRSSLDARSVAEELFSAHALMQESLDKRDPTSFASAFRDAKKSLSRLRRVLRLNSRP